MVAWNSMKLYGCEVRHILLPLFVNHVMCETVDVSSSVWVPGALRIRNLTRIRYETESLENAIDHSFDSQEQGVTEINRGFIDLQPALMQTSNLNTYFPTYANTPMRNKTVWAFMSVIIIPPISCESVNKVASLFDAGLRRVNSDVPWVRSTARRVGSDVCDDGVCPCTTERSGTARYTTRVLELETLCETNRLALPMDNEFPFVYDSRTAMPFPNKKKRGRLLDEDQVISHFRLMAASIFLRFVDPASINSSTLISSSVMRFSNSVSIDRHV
jgi:hypothetical protein